MAPTCTLVMTTVHDSPVLEGYARNFERFGHLDSVDVVVITDRKTPAAVPKRCAELVEAGLRVSCPTLDEQTSFLERVGSFGTVVPFDSDHRRNIGYLMALERGSDFLISIDDDNFCLDDEDVFAAHSVVCEAPRNRLLCAAENSWLNVCNMLDLEPNSTVYPRGYPYRVRHREESLEFVPGHGAVRLNAGLWLGEPDLDAMTWLVAPVRARGARPESVVLAADTWSPINTQNTALERSVIPSYYFVRMGRSLGGREIDRFGDIFSGYFSRACLRHMGDLVSFGRPLADHRRNAHDFLLDATREMAGIEMLEELTAWLQEVVLEGKTYSEAYVSLSHLMEDEIERFRGSIWDSETRSFLHETARDMRTWVLACELLR